MKIEQMIEVMDSALNDFLCEGCSIEKSPYGSCGNCRSEVAKKIKDILLKEKADNLETFDMEFEYCQHCDSKIYAHTDYEYCPYCGEKLDQ